MASAGAPRRQRLKSGFSTKAAAIAAMNELQVTRVAGTHVEPTKLTVGDYLKLWVAGGCGGVRPWTLRGYSAVVRVHLVPRIGAVRLQSLSRSEIKALYGDLRESGFARNPTPERLQHLRQMAARYQELRRGPNPRSAVRTLVQETGHPEVTVRYWTRRCRALGMLPDSGPAPATNGLSAKSVWNIHICLRAALNDAVEDGLLRSNPAKGVLKPPRGQKRIKTWTREEMAAFLNHVRQHRNYALYHVALYTGMRRGELLGCVGKTYAGAPPRSQCKPKRDSAPRTMKPTGMIWMTPRRSHRPGAVPSRSTPMSSEYWSNTAKPRSSNGGVGATRTETRAWFSAGPTARPTTPIPSPASSTAWSGGQG